MNANKLKDQFLYLKRIRKYSLARLIEEHTETFEGTKWWIPSEYFTKEQLIKRLWYYYAAKNYHEDGELRTKFFQKASKYLRQNPVEDKVIKETKLRELTEQGYLTPSRIRQMPIQEVDSLLSLLGLFAEVAPVLRRKILLQYITNPKTRNTVRKIRGRKPGLDNQYMLMDIIMANPNMHYYHFRKKFGHVMPTVTSGSYRTTRWTLRKMGKLKTRLKTTRYPQNE